MTMAGMAALPVGAHVSHGSAEPPTRRAQLLAQAEALLARRDAAAALQAFESAGLQLHAADAELGVVRCMMQQGEYRRALAFAAHTAGAHQDEAGGAALYAWLLHAGGQGALARGVLQQARDRDGQQPLLAAVSRELARPWPIAQGPLLVAPSRLAPYANPVRARVVCSATLVRGGRSALLPASRVREGARYWVRNGLGDTVAARASARVPNLGLAELLLDAPLPAADVRLAARDPFPGSVAFAVEYAPHPAGLPAWPLLKPGFVGAALPQDGLRALGVALPAGSPRGGPVFDRHGALCGIALNQGHLDRLVGVARLRAWSGSGLPAPNGDDAGPAAMGLDAVYELGLRVALQVLSA